MHATTPSLVTLLPLVFVPAMLLVPALVASLWRTTAETDAARTAVRRRSIALRVATALALGLWVAIVVGSVALPGNPLLVTAGRFGWLLFFPLWFGFAMPLLRAKNPEWDTGIGAASGPVRTASLVNRSRRSPIGRGAWIIAAAIAVGLLAVMGARGLAGPFDSESLRMQWIWMTVAYGVILALHALVVPWGIQVALAEPEPLDLRGSRELEQRYEAFRSTKARGLFGLFAVALPVVIGGSFAIAVWIDSDAGGKVGALGGIAIGLAGGWFGTVATIRRCRIARFKSELEAKSQPTTR